MNFKQFILENSNLYENIKIQWIDPEEDWDLAAEAEQVAKQSGIRPDRSKTLTFIALDGDKVVGGVWTSLHKYDEDDNGMRSHQYSFDVAVDKNYRDNRQIGMQLIRTAEKERDNLADAHGAENIYTRLYVVNPKLARVLQHPKYGNYDLEHEYSDGSAHLVKY